MTSHPMTKTHHQGLAALMSALLPGFGQLYNGQINKAIWLFLSFAFLSVPAVALIALHLPSSWTIPALVLGVLAALSIWFGGIAEAWHTAKTGQFNPRQPWQVSGAYVLVFVICDLIALPLLVDHVQTNQISSFRIPSSSMEPSILKGDILFADRRYNRPGASLAVHRGDAAIFTYPDNRTVYYIKRIIGLPGDQIKISGHDVWVNGQMLSRRAHQEANSTVFDESLDGMRWQVQWTKPVQESKVFELTVPPGHAFVLGDNRDAGTDGRHFGAVPLSDIVGKARQIWFSSGDGGVRWARVGQILGE